MSQTSGPSIRLPVCEGADHLRETLDGLLERAGAGPLSIACWMRLPHFPRGHPKQRRRGTFGNDPATGTGER